MSDRKRPLEFPLVIRLKDDFHGRRVWLKRKQGKNEIQRERGPRGGRFQKIHPLIRRHFKGRESSRRDSSTGPSGIVAVFDATTRARKTRKAESSRREGWRSNRCSSVFIVFACSGRQRKGGKKLRTNPGTAHSKQQVLRPQRGGLPGQASAKDANCLGVVDQNLVAGRGAYALIDP